MSSGARKAEKRREWELERERRDVEASRVEGLCIFARLQESNFDDDMRSILTLICEKAGVDIYEGEMS